MRMKKVYPFLLACFLFAGCSKDFLKRYEDRVEGTWRLVDVDRIGFGGTLDHLPFTEGQFTFLEHGGLRYVNANGAAYSGNWDIRRQWNSYDDDRVKTLRINAIDFTSQDIKSEFFDKMVFTSTDRFVTYIYSGAHTYRFSFRR